MAKPVLVLLPVLGLTWVCGVFVHLSIVWAYVFIVLNSLQVSLCRVDPHFTARQVSVVSCASVHWLARPWVGQVISFSLFIPL